MTEKPDSDQPATDRPPVDQAPDLKPEGDKPDSAQTSQDESNLQEVVDGLVKQVRALQSDKDRGVERNKTAIENLVDRIEGLKLTPEQREQWDKIVLNERLDRLEKPSSPEVPASTPPATNVTEAEVPLTLQQVKDVVAEAMKPPATGASAVTPSGGITPLTELNAEGAAEELDNLKPMSQRTEQELKRTDELLQIIEKEVDKT